MAKSNTKRVSRRPQITKNGSNALKIQKTINRDYGILFDDYRKLSIELWRMPATKFVLGGVALTSLVPVLMGALRKNPQIGNFFSKKAKLVENKVDEIGGMINEKISDLRRTDVENEVNARH